MAKILVADDNSNIQKMVGLALKDQGIDVVAVGNGEAAVRKISDVRPDLVLADVFMPVRNGYEVCQYVKTDSALSHIPVILLVGAFDPLDEQEAQRVGADGVLKKPFIPPDPLISMVKSALQRAGVIQGSPVTAKASEQETSRVPDMLAPVHAALPTVSATSAQSLHEDSGTLAKDQSFVDEVPAPPAPVRIDSGSQPVAFGSLLESPTAESEEESFVSQPPPEFALERDWHAQDEEETEEEEEEPPKWRPEGQDQEEAPAAKSSKSKSTASNWRTGGFEQIAASKARNTWEPEEEPDLVTTAPAASNRVPEMSAASQAPVLETARTSAPANSFIAETLPAIASNVPSEMASTKAVTAVEDQGLIAGPEPPAAEKKQAEAKDSWFSVTSSPWDAEIKKANQLASTWGTPSPVSERPVPPISTEKPVETVNQKMRDVIEDAAPAPGAVVAIPEEAAQVTEDAAVASEAAASAETSFYAQEANQEPATTEAASPSTDDVVAKVLAKMSPEVLQAVTREILKPVVEAMVKDELKKKS